MTFSPSEPTLGGAVLLPNSLRGWQPGPLLLPTPVLLLRYRDGLSRLFLPGGEEPLLTRQGSPLAFLEEILANLKAKVPPEGPKAGKPSFPMAVTAFAYEFGRVYTPHRHAFPHAGALEDDEFFAAIFMDAYRPDPLGGTERLGYAGAIPEGWMEGAPALATRPWGHDAPPVVPFALKQGRMAHPLEPATSFDDYAARIVRIHDYLAAGDIYQANLTVPLRGTTNAGPEDILDAALEEGGAPFAGLFLTPGGTILSLSPELFVRRRGDEIETRPIKGTRPLPSTGVDARRVREELLTSAKDRAEHLMIVDLERNDLGRICAMGSVEVNPFMEAVEHPTVLHLESTVRGKLRAGITLDEIFAATFPGGSISGAPKKRALEIIAELEQSPRGYYCGALGWIDCSGDCELSLTIRTAMLRPGGAVEYHAGGGIVADSAPAEEWEEMRTKTAFFDKVLRHAAEVCRHDEEDH